MSVCNIYKKLFGDDGKQNSFYCFTEYSDALAGVITDDDHVKVTPSKYILLNLEVTDALANFLQNKYDNITCILRDTKDKGYKDYYLGTLLNIMREYDVWTEGTSESAPVCVGDIDIVSTNTIDGSNYTEWMVNVGPTDKKNYNISLNFSKESVVDKNQYIRGYESEASRASGVAEYGYISSANGEDLYTCTMTPTTTDETEFQFDCVLILMDMEVGGVTYSNIPMGIYVMPDKITKKISDSTIYGQGTSWGLKVAMRFANTVDGSNAISIEEDDQCHFLACIDRLNDTIDMMNAMTKKFNDFYNYTRSLVWEGQPVQAEPKNWVEFNNKK